MFFNTKNGKCQILHTTYENSGECPFCKENIQEVGYREVEHSELAAVEDPKRNIRSGTSFRDLISAEEQKPSELAAVESGPVATKAEKEEFIMMHLKARQKEIEYRKCLDRIKLECRVPGRKPLDGMPHTRGVRKDLSDSMIKIEKAEQTVIKQKKVADTLQTVTLEAIKKIEKKRCREILKLICINGVKRYQIAESWGVSPTRVSQIYGEALQAFEIPVLSEEIALFIQWPISIKEQC